MKRFVKVATLVLAALLLCSSCGVAKEKEETTTATTAIATTTTAMTTTTAVETEVSDPELDPSQLYIIHEDICNYSIVLPAGSLTKQGGSGMFQNPDTGKLVKMVTTVDTPIAKATNSLISALAEKTGTTIPVTDDGKLSAANSGEYEILIGLTDRAESIEMHKQLKERTFAVKTTDKKMVIIGYDDNMTAAAIRYCVENYILGYETAGQVIDTGIFTVPANMMAVSPVEQETPGNTIHLGGEYTLAQATEFVKIEADGGYRVMQGGCTDGQYLYYCIENQWLEKSETYIYKVSAETGKVVKRSESLQLDHSNDMAYNAKLNQLLVVHNAPNRKLVSFVDADTLEKIKTINIGREIFSLSYNETRDQYVVGNSGGQTFSILDGEFNRICDFIPVPSTKNTTQGMTSDDNYIYFAQSGANVVVVYDWDGQQICIIPIEFTDIETENISLIGNDFYIGFYPGEGGIVYRTKLTVKK